MTRGQITVITDNGIYTSIEFNGDMYLDDDRGNGIEAFEELKNILTVKEYQKFVKDFNDEHYEYKEKLVYYYPLPDYEHMLDMTKGYFDNWFSDYLYIKNIGKNNVEIKTQSHVFILKPEDILVLNFGEDSENTRDVNYKITRKVSPTLLEIIENQGWHVDDCDDELYLSKYSPQGEDFGFEVRTKYAVEEIYEYAEQYDPDEHGRMWINANDPLVPTDIRVVAQDAYDIQEMLDDLCEALKDFR